jgi:hypothetical protein
MENCNIELAITSMFCDDEGGGPFFAMAWSELEARGQTLAISPVIEVETNIRNTTAKFFGRDIMLDDQRNGGRGNYKINVDEGLAFFKGDIFSFPGEST